MKKFKPENEIKKNNHDQIIRNAFIPVLVVGCACLAMVGVAFSYKLTDDDRETYTIDLEILDGDEIKTYHQEAREGYFSDKLDANGKYSGLYCESGDISLDELTNKFEIPYLNNNVECTVLFKEESSKNLSADSTIAIKDNDGTSYYYRGDVTNNYLYFNNMMFRIIRVNGDGTLRLMLDDSSLSVVYGNNVYANSNAKVVVDQWFNEFFSDNKYVVSDYFDVSNYSEIEMSNLISLEGSYEGYVGLLSAREAAIINDSSQTSYLGNIALANGAFDTNVYVTNGMDVIASPVTESYVIKPVINIVNVDMNGIGNIDDPYVIKED